MKQHNIISIDLAKNIFQVCLLDASHQVTFNRKVKRHKLLSTVLNLDAKVLVMEACYSSNHWGRLFQKHGYQVALIPPHQVKPFVTGNKNDYNDAIAIAEAAQRPKATKVPVKSLEQQDIQSLYRIRERLIRHRTAVMNQLRGLLAEYGLILTNNAGAIRKTVPALLDCSDNGLTSVAQNFLSELYQEIQSKDQAVERIEQQIETLLQANPDYQQLQTLPGIGPIIAGNLIAHINQAESFKNGRQMAAWLGLTPKQHSSGEHTKMLGISKRGNQSLRKHFIHGARAVLNWCHKKNDPLSLWLQQLLRKKHPCVVIVALANKMARIAWAMLTKKQNFDPKLCTATSV